MTSNFPGTFQLSPEMFGSEICSRIWPFLGIHRLEFTNADRLPYYVIEQDFVQDLCADQVIFDWNIDKVQISSLNKSNIIVNIQMKNCKCLESVFPNWGVAVYKGDLVFYIHINLVY